MAKILNSRSNNNCLYFNEEIYYLSSTLILLLLLPTSISNFVNYKHGKAAKYREKQQSQIRRSIGVIHQKIYLLILIRDSLSRWLSLHVLKFKFRVCIYFISVMSLFSFSPVIIKFLKSGKVVDELIFIPISSFAIPPIKIMLQSLTESH